MSPRVFLISNNVIKMVTLILWPMTTVMLVAWPSHKYCCRIIKRVKGPRFRDNRVRRSRRNLSGSSLNISSFRKYYDTLLHLLGHWVEHSAFRTHSTPFLRISEPTPSIITSNTDVVLPNPTPYDLYELHLLNFTTFFLSNRIKSNRSIWEFQLFFSPT